ncbi:L-ornithine 5-monooxygenase protein [Rutstroemia sp. NJR-2017a BVV2]|nr:L-ornithine 5-monooxygenase protein [Rutstroemia sp. NJR-2017a BVV2]
MNVSKGTTKHEANMSLQIPIPISSPSVSRPQPHPPLLNTYDTIIPIFSIESLSLAIAAFIRASQLNLNILFLLPSNIDSAEDISAQDIGGSFLEDFATGLDPTSRYTYLNYLAEEGKLVEWMSLGEKGMRPRGNEWEGYVKWCAEMIVKESEAGMDGGVQFLRGDAVGMRERGNRRSVDVFVRLEDGEEVMIRAGRVIGADQEAVDGMMEVLEGVKKACEGLGQSELNLATIAKESDRLLSRWEKEEERRMLRAVL